MIHTFENCIPVFTKDASRCKKHVREKAFQVFNPNPKRFQRKLAQDDPLIPKILSFLKENGFLRGRYFGGAVVLKSTKGCERQSWHTDYDPSALSKLQNKPLGVILAIEGGTKFSTPNKTYRLKRGDLLVFDGDVVHAGSAYKKHNTRIHLYVDSLEHSRLSNKTWIVNIEM